MSKQRISHDAAMACATKLTEELRGLVREDELRDLWELLYEAVKAALESALVLYERELHRLRPGKS
jgi:hypothetical protein